jgi:hypothetical protein
MGRGKRSKKIRGWWSSWELRGRCPKRLKGVRTYICNTQQGAKTDNRG